MLCCARLRAALLDPAADVLPVPDAAAAVVPAGALVDCVPLAVPPEVLTRNRLSDSGLSVHFGATSMIT